MKKNFKWMTALAVAVAATSCSQDDLMGGLENNAQDNGAIGVNTFIANGTRGVAYDNVDEFREANGNFDLYAWEKLAGDAGYAESAFMDGVKFIVDGNGWDYEDKGKVRFWQELGEGSTVDFYAVSPAGLENNNIGSGEQTIPFTVETNSADQVDLMYATAKEINADGTTAEGEDVKQNGVKLDFHHALSQIVFKAKVHEDYMDYVSAEVEKVEIVNLYGTGIFDFASAANGVYSEETKVNTSWKYQDMDGNEQSADASYAAEFTGPVVVNAEYTSQDEKPLTDKTTALLLLPQNITGAEIEDNTAQPTEGTTGTYFAITCKVWYQRTTTDSEGNENTEEIQIVGKDDATATLYYPLTTNWYEGWKYTYTFVFSANTADPITISEQSSVDAWWPGDNENNTDVPETGEEEENEDELTQDQLNARLVANWFASANAATITTTEVTFINNENYLSLDDYTNNYSQYNIPEDLKAMYYSYNELDNGGLLNVAIPDENGNYWRVATADEWNMLVFKMDVLDANNGWPYFFDEQTTPYTGSETVTIDGNETSAEYTFGLATAFEALSYDTDGDNMPNTGYPVVATRFKGTKQHAAYKYAPITLSNGLQALEITIKGLKSNEEVPFDQINTTDFWTEDDCFKVVLPAVNFVDSYDSGFYDGGYGIAGWYGTANSSEDEYPNHLVQQFEPATGPGYIMKDSYGLSMQYPVRMIQCDADGNLVLE